MKQFLTDTFKGMCFVFAFIWCALAAGRLGIWILTTLILLAETHFRLACLLGSLCVATALGLLWAVTQEVDRSRGFGCDDH